ncbi:MAG: RsbRD N-terminal domain-containing protein [Isosphaeraceae bacterium]
MEAGVKFVECLEQKRAAIATRWLAVALSAYPAPAAELFQRERDPFANPVGAALRVGLGAALEALVQGREPTDVAACLDDILKMRAAQDLTPTQALSLIFSLKEISRAELQGDGRGSVFSSELAALDKQIDQLALAAFDRYVGHRGRIYELRVREVKRSVSVLVERMNRRRPPLPADLDLVQLETASSSPVEERSDS